MGKAFATATLTGLATVSPSRAADRPDLAGPAPVVELYGAALDMLEPSPCPRA